MANLLYLLLDCGAIERTPCTCLVIPAGVPLVSSAADADRVSDESMFGASLYNAMQDVLPFTVSRQMPANPASAS
eukprot:5301371-Lingulodinium_polyedra.AAC.1